MKKRHKENDYEIIVREREVATLDEELPDDLVDTLRKVIIEAVTSHPDFQPDDDEILETLKEHMEDAIQGAFSEAIDDTAKALFIKRGRVADMAQGVLTDVVEDMTTYW